MAGLSLLRMSSLLVVWLCGTVCLAGPLDWPTQQGPQGDGSTTVWNLPVTLEIDHQTNRDSSWVKNQVVGLPSLVAMNSRVYCVEHEPLGLPNAELALKVSCYTVPDGEPFWVSLLPMPIAELLLKNPTQHVLMGDPLWRQLILVTPQQVMCWNSENGELLWQFNATDLTELAMAESQGNSKTTNFQAGLVVDCQTPSVCYWNQSLFVPFRFTEGGRKESHLLAIDRRRGHLEWTAALGEGDSEGLIPQVMLSEKQSRPVLLCSYASSHVDVICPSLGEALGRVSLPEGRQLQQVEMVIRKNRVTSPVTLPEDFPAVLLRTADKEKTYLEMHSMNAISGGEQAASLWSIECESDVLMSRSENRLFLTRENQVEGISLLAGAEQWSWKAFEAGAKIVCLRYADHRFWAVSETGEWKLGLLDDAGSVRTVQSGKFPDPLQAPLIFANSNVVVLLKDRLVGISHRLPGELAPIIADELRRLSSREFRNEKGDPAKMKLFPSAVKLQQGQEYVFQPRVYDAVGRYLSLAKQSDTTFAVQDAQGTVLEVPAKWTDTGLQVSIPVGLSAPAALKLIVTSEMLKQQATATIVVQPLALSVQR